MLEEKIKELKDLYQEYGIDFERFGLPVDEKAWYQAQSLREEIDEAFNIAPDDWDDYLNEIVPNGEFTFKKFSIPVNDRKIINYEAILPKSILKYFPFLFAYLVDINDNWSRFVWTGSSDNYEFGRTLLHNLELFGNFAVLRKTLLEETENGKKEIVLKDATILDEFKYDENGNVCFGINHTLIGENFDNYVMNIVRGKLEARRENELMRNLNKNKKGD